MNHDLCLYSKVHFDVYQNEGEIWEIFLYILILCIQLGGVYYPMWFKDDCTLTIFCYTSVQSIVTGYLFEGKYVT